MTSIGVSPKFGAGHLFLADARLALAVANHLRYLTLEKTLGVTRQQANVVTVVAALTAGELLHEAAKAIPHPRLPGAENVALGMLGLGNAVHGVAGPASRQIPHFNALLGVALVGGLAAPGIRAYQRARATERRVRAERIRRYVAATRPASAR